MKHKSSLIGLVLALGTAVTCSAVTLGQIDTFEDGTTQNWVAGLLGSPHPAPPVNVASGGPNGANDHYLLVTSLGGLGPGSRLSVISFLNQWAGNYIAAGVTSISMDVRNFGPSDLYLRLGFSDPLAGPPANAAFSDVAVFLPAGGDWTSIVFSLALPGLGVEAGDREEALKNTTELRIYSSQPARFPNPASPIPAVNAVLGIDNIRAPEAGSTALLLGLATGMIGILQGWPQIRRGLAGRKRAFPLRSMA